MKILSDFLATELFLTRDGITSTQVINRTHAGSYVLAFM